MDGWMGLVIEYDYVGVWEQERAKCLENASSESCGVQWSKVKELNIECDVCMWRPDG